MTGLIGHSFEKQGCQMYNNYDICTAILPSLGCMINNAKIAIMHDNLPFCDNYISIVFLST